MITIDNIDSNAVQTINVDEETSIVSITFKSSGKEYNYALNGISPQDFVNTVNEKIQNKTSVGRFVNKSIREDQTLQIMAV